MANLVPHWLRPHTDRTPWPKGLSHRLTSTQETQRLSHPLLLPQSRLSFRAVCHVGTGNLYSNTKHKGAGHHCNSTIET